MNEQGDMFRPLPAGPPVQPLRPYQEEAVKAVFAELNNGNRSTLVVMATGLGKTRLATEIIGKWPGRVLWLTHREELIRQSSERIARDTGRTIGVEKAAEYGSSRDDVVVASVQTLYQEERRKRWEAEHFGLIVVDEAHHATSESWRSIVDHFAGAKLCGLTATPDRADRMALGQVFDSVAYVYDIENGIKDGWLCPILCATVLVESLSLADVKTTAGDLDRTQLDAVMAAEKVMHGVVKPTIELAGGRRTVVFTTSVANAHRMTEIFCRYKPDSAKAVDGKTEIDERRSIIAGHRSGQFQFLINVGIVSEGYDDPAISCIAMARPTKSRSLYTQCIGRSLRIVPGKADALILDYCGNAGRHKLVSPVDILAGRYPDDVVERAKQIVAQEPQIAAADALGRAEAQLAREREEAEARARRRPVRANVRYSSRFVDPFHVLGLRPEADRWGGQFGTKPATDKQLALLGKMKIPLPDNCTSAQASRLIGTLFKRRDLGLCTYGQAKTLQRFGYETARLSFDRAHELMSALAANNWRPIGRAPERKAGQD